MNNQTSFDPFSQNDPFSILDTVNTSNSNNNQQPSDPFDLLSGDTTNPQSAVSPPNNTTSSDPDPFAMFGNDNESSNRPSDLLEILQTPQQTGINQQSLLSKISNASNTKLALKESIYPSHTIHIGTYNRLGCPQCSKWMNDQVADTNLDLFWIPYVHYPDHSPRVKELITKWKSVTITDCQSSPWLKGKSQTDLVIHGYMRQLQSTLPMDASKWMDPNYHKKEIVFIHIPTDVIDLCISYLYVSQTALLLNEMKTVMVLPTKLEWKEVQIISMKKLNNDEAIKTEYSNIMMLLYADRLISAKEEAENFALCNSMYMDLEKTMQAELSGMEYKNSVKVESADASDPFGLF